MLCYTKAVSNLIPLALTEYFEAPVADGTFCKVLGLPGNGSGVLRVVGSTFRIFVVRNAQFYSFASILTL